MKRIISLLITAAFLLNSTAAFAKLTSTGKNTGTEIASAWLETMQSDNLVGEILNGNVAFVHNCNRAWANDGIVTMQKKAVYITEEKLFMLPVEAVNQIFGLNESGTNGMISSERVKTLTGKTVFIDPRGFVLFSAGTVVNTTVPTGYNAYRDFYTVANAMGYIAWEDREFTEDERDAYIKKWRGALSLPEDADRAANASFINGSIEAAKKEMDKITVGSDGKYTFKDITLDGYDLTGSGLTTFKGQLYNAYARLVTIAIGYNCMEDKSAADATAMRDIILGGINFLLPYYEQEWNYNTDSKQNWTLTQFSLPIVCSNLLCLMYEDMSQAERNKTTDQVFDKAPIPNVRTAGKQNNEETYTNRLWKSFSYFNVAVIANDTYRMNYALKYASSAFLYSPRNMGFDELQFNKDGFYTDGSMIFHTNIPYNLGYGLSYSVLVYEFMELTKDTKFDIRNIYGFENVYDFCTNNMLPFLTDEMMFKMVVGRGNVLPDTSMLRNCAYIANNAPEEQRRKISAQIKEILDGRVLSAGSKQYVINTPMLENMCSEFSRYTSALPENAGNTNKSTVYYNQDQVIHIRDEFTAALSMSSTRIEKYESFGTTNSKGWYQGDGMLYIYTDGSQYDTGYFNNVNPYYMPGTTVDSTERDEINTATAENWGVPDNDWAGGVTDGENTVAGYQLGNAHVSNLEGKKSYFMFGDKIICMGTGIKGGSGNAYTVVENRIISKPSENVKPIEAGYTVKNITTNNPAKEETVYQVADGNLISSCSLAAFDDWIVFDFGEKVNIGLVGMAFLNGDARSELATIQISDDGQNFTDVQEFASTGESKDVELYEMNCSGRYFKIISHGNSRGNSWFNLAEITFYKDTATPEDIEEAKNIISEGYDDLVVDDALQEPVFNTATQIENPGWVWLENHEGLVFLTDAKLNVLRRREPSSPAFMQIALEHGERPIDEGYAYVMLPKADKEETKAFAESDEIEILEKSKKMHAVYDHTSGLIGANVFQKGAVLEGITFNTPCSVLINKAAGRIYISEPTWTQKSVSFTLPDNIENATGTGISVSGKDVVLDTSVKKGSTHEISCRFIDESAVSTGIKVMNYHLRASEHFISTTLFATSPAGAVSFEIAAQPQLGRAMIFGNTLYYYASGNAANDSLTVRAKDSTGNYADFSVTITK